jgi:protein tyrosine phosphatase
MTTPPVEMMFDIVRIALNEINCGGKVGPNSVIKITPKCLYQVAVHCHAGFGRTGIVIASIMMAKYRYDAERTISIIRQKRCNSLGLADLIYLCL